MKDARFKFGKNWISYLNTIDEESLLKSKENITLWLNDKDLSKLKVIDIGCGSGIHSYNFWQLGVKEIISFDYDADSVKATRLMWKKAGEPENWKIYQGSILNESFLMSLGKFDLIYSWGVLHHTGEMWNAINNSVSILTNSNSIVWISLYQGVETYKFDLELKLNYNQSSWLGKRFILLKEIIKVLRKRRSKGETLFFWKEKKGRGMNIYNDLVDWVGGYPYEVCSMNQIIEFMENNGGWNLLKFNDSQACAVYLFAKDKNNTETKFQEDIY